MKSARCAVLAIVLALAGAHSLSGEKLRKVGLHAEAEKTELGLAFDAIENYVDQLELLVLDALKNPHTARPYDEAALFKACGCDKGALRRLDNYAVPSEQIDSRFTHTNGMVGKRCLRKEPRHLPDFEEDRCGPMCYNSTDAAIDIAHDASWTTICPPPLVAECTKIQGAQVSSCAFPFRSKQSTLAERVNDLNTAVSNYVHNPDHLYTPSTPLLLDFIPDFMNNLNKIESQLMGKIHTAKMSYPTRTKMQQCGCPDMPANVALTPLRHKLPGWRKAIGWTCAWDHKNDVSNVELCGPLCRRDPGKVSTTIVTLCSPGMTPTCQGCAPPSHMAELAHAKIRDENPYVTGFDVSSHIRNQREEERRNDEL